MSDDCQRLLGTLREIYEWADDRVDIDWNDQPNDAMQVMSMLNKVLDLIRTTP